MESLASPEQYNLVTTVASPVFKLISKALSFQGKKGATKNKINRRVKTKTVLQMESTECGAASLAMVLEYFGKVVSLEELRYECGVSRDGSKAINLVQAARKYGLIVKALRCEPKHLLAMPVPAIIFWNFNHYLVLEGFKGDKVYLNDPAYGSRIVSLEDFDRSFTGVALTFMEGPDFKKGGEKKSMLKGLWKLVEGRQKTFLWVVLFGVALFIPGLMLPMLTKYFVDDVLIAGQRALIAAIIGALLGTAVLRGVLSLLREHFLLKLEQDISTTSAVSFYWHVLRLPMEFFAQRHKGEVGARVRFNDDLAKLAAGKLSRTVLDLLASLVFLVIMFTYDWVLALIGLTISLLNIVIMRYSTGKIRDGSQRIIQDQGKLFGITVAGLQNIETIKASGNESDFFAKWTGYQAKLIRGEQATGITIQMYMAVPLLLAALNTVIILAIGSLRVMESHITYGTLLAFQGLVASFLAPVSNLVQFGGSLVAIKGYADRIEDVLRYPAVEGIPLHPDSIKVTPDAKKDKLQGYLELKDVSFGYSRLEPPLIEGFSIALKPGEQVALIGGSGSGKTTVSRVAAGLYRPWQGSLYLDGIERKELSRGKISHSVAMVDQEICLFEGTVRENIAMWDTELKEEDILAALRDACMLSEIMDRPGGLEYIVQENGRNFSGGQRQRLEIARALAGNPKVLIMDEATSALDSATEKLVLQNLRKRGCTCLFVAHRLSTIRDSDEIIVMDKGKVDQRGNHNQLREVAGPYRKLMSME